MENISEAFKNNAFGIVDMVLEIAKHLLFQRIFWNAIMVIKSSLSTPTYVDS